MDSDICLVQFLGESVISNADLDGRIVSAICNHHDYFIANNELYDWYAPQQNASPTSLLTEVHPMTFRGLFCFFTFSTMLLISTAIQAQEMTNKSGQNVAEMKFTNIPGLPTCSVGSVQNGDPTKGPAIIFAKIDAGCMIPWHWHTPSEHLMMVGGTARIEMKDGKPLTLESGGFALMPSHHAHQFRCERSCSLYIYSDAAFDIHYVDAQGNEISTEDALKSTMKKKP